MCQADPGLRDNPNLQTFNIMCLCKKADPFHYDKSADRTALHNWFTRNLLTVEKYEKKAKTDDLIFYSLIITAHFEPSIPYIKKGLISLFDCLGYNKEVITFNKEDIL
ncbi:hypothetical protein SAMN02745823_01322 [Sporobacter termitidis DSM 10068]|uniref:Uncharacterized protein n=1 Tax=Sporobacter termitidis DSM 10068 TaxID=1123282 RepID=A0A1M5WL18_9FIRM|nr:hypothetical protein SAMN02745823_01322 [Sporobacter termitidis DSM 10068]